MNQFSSDDDSSESDTKKCKQGKSTLKVPIALLPPPLPVNISSVRKSLNISKENITPLTIIANKKQSKRATVSSISPIADIKKSKFLDKIINLRQRVADNAQQRKKVMSLRNVSELAVIKKAVNISKLPMKAFEAGSSFSSESQSSSIVSLNSQSEELLPSSEMSNDSQSPSFQLLSDKIKNPMTQTRSSISNSIYQTSKSAMNVSPLKTDVK